MPNPSVSRLVLFTISVITGTGLILADRLHLVGLLLVCFGPVIVMNEREREDQKKTWTTPLTKFQIIRGFLPLFVILGVLYFLATDTSVQNSTPEQGAGNSGWDFGVNWTWTAKVVVLIWVVFVIGQRWMRWYQMHTLNEQTDTTA